MNTIPKLFFCLLALVLTACGGSNNSISPQTYKFVTPQLNYIFSYNQTYSNSSSVRLIQQLVTQVDSDGSFKELISYPNEAVVLGTSLTEEFDNNGHLLSSMISRTVTPPDQTCTYTPHRNGEQYPLSVGETWSYTYNSTCDANQNLVPSSTYTDLGSVVNIESLVVPAGSFNALKIQRTVTQLSAGIPDQGTTTDTITEWRDVVTGYLLKSIDVQNITGGNIVQASPVVTTTVLQSQGF